VGSAARLIRCGFDPSAQRPTVGFSVQQINLARVRSLTWRNFAEFTKVQKNRDARRRRSHEDAERAARPAREVVPRETCLRGRARLPIKQQTAPGTAKLNLKAAHDAR